jgi:hypothetical protein
LTGDSRVVVTVVLGDCRRVAVKANVISVEVVGRQGRLNKVQISKDDGFVFVNQ